MTGPAGDALPEGRDPYDLYGAADSAGDAGARYSEHVRRKKLILIAGFALLAAMVLAASCMGAIRIPAADVFRYIILFDDGGMGRIVWGVRLPRIIACVLVGAGLAVSGAVMQCVLRNHLASPYTLGISGAAAFGASFAIIFLQAGSGASSSVSVSNPYVVTLCAFAFSLAATGAVLLLARVAGASAEAMVLAGIAISAMAAAGLSFMQYIATDSQLANIVSWSFGDMGRATWRWNLMVLAVLAPSALYFAYRRWDYNAMDSGEETAKGLGVNTGRERMIGMVLASLASSVIVSFFGIVAFIGLLGPHIARMILGSDHRFLIPGAMIFGAAMLLASDKVGMAVLSPAVVPVGIITSALGGPLFIYLLVRRRG
ncbi:MAG: iron ABC transporter permease [Candidatus Methanoplasma sp.]|jgi:iron complex transport system permease protein|nr:iron ABC transporter permease [Candidatus Methanoplasma sp.]